MSNIIIDSRFDSGSIDVMTVHQASAMLRLKHDKDSEFKQWFHFRVANCGGRELVLKILQEEVEVVMDQEEAQHLRMLKKL